MAVYVREAHPTDGAFSANNEAAGVSVRQPRNPLERTQVAGACHGKLGITMPLVVDTIDDRVGHAYSGMPDRLYVVGKDGTVSYQGGRGPFGFKPAEMEQALLLQLLAEEPPAGPK